MSSFIQMNKYQSNGFTIVELMIVISIVGILSALAVPAYTGYTRQADRAAAQSDVYELAQIMERGFTENRAYNAAGLDLTNTLAQFNSGSPQRYTFSVTRTATTYDVIAVATSDSRDTYDLTIDERGAERYRDTGTSSWVDNPWDQIPD